MSELTDFAFSKIDSDLEFLVACFREVLEELGQPELAAALPWDDVAAPEPLPPRLGQAFSVAFQLLNLVEENAAAQTRRKRESEEGMAAERGLWGETLQKLEADGFSSGEIADFLPVIRVEPVLTAHPTEAKRLTVLEQHRDLFRALGERENPNLTPAEREAIRRRVKSILERLWRTGEILLAKPEVADERHQIEHYLREIFPDALVRLDDRLRAAWKAAGYNLDELKMPRLRFGTWVGGDRDGHGLVTAQVTANTLAELRLNALVVLERKLERLAEKMSLSVYGQEPPAFLAENIALLAGELGERAAPILAEDEEEPWRQFTRLMIAKLPLDSRADQPYLLEESAFYRDPAQLQGDINILKGALEAVGAHRLASGDVGPIERAIDCFGFHLANLDVRQNSAFHDRAMSQLMVAAGLDGEDFPNWSEAERLRFLNNELRSPRPFLHPGARMEDEAEAVLSCYRVLAEHLDKYGTGSGIGSLIVSMTHELSDLLVVFVLAREAGLMRMTGEGLVCALPVVPLFETVDDLTKSPDILRAWLEHPVARLSLKKQAGAYPPTQQVMIGYSDSNKDMGIFASQWGLQSGQSAMAQVGRETGVKIRFFHGRGGTISRGAGPTHRFLEALPHGSLSGDVRTTEQGETIAQKFGNRATATYNLELLLAGVTSNTLRHQRRDKPEFELDEIAGRMAKLSGAAYQKLLNSENFIPFFRQATPIDVLEQSRIGSRPARRTGQATLADLRAIPWVFSWNQSRFYLPGWYGIGSGLMELREQSPADFDRFAAGVKEWKFLRYVLTNVESNLASTDRELMEEYANLVEDKETRERIFGMITSEWDRTAEALELIWGGTMATRRPRMMKTLEVRAHALHVLHLQQIELIKKWRALRNGGDEANAEAMLPELLLSINAIASGLRTTG